MHLTDLVGRSVSFRYPAHNFALDGIPRTTERRRVRIDAVRDCEALPIEPETRLLNPHLQRGRWLVEAFDHDRRGARSFYWDSMQDVRLVDHPSAIGEPVPVFIVEKPDDWHPTSPRDVPPNVERHQEPTRQAAESLAFGFNCAEMQTPKGWWAVV